MRVEWWHRWGNALQMGNICASLNCKVNSVCAFKTSGDPPGLLQDYWQHSTGLHLHLANPRVILLLLYLSKLSFISSSGIMARILHVYPLSGLWLFLIFHRSLKSSHMLGCNTFSLKIKASLVSPTYNFAHRLVWHAFLMNLPHWRKCRPCALSSYLGQNNFVIGYKCNWI